MNHKVGSELQKIIAEDKREKAHKMMTLKERLIEQKMERMNVNEIEKKNSKIPNKVHFPYGKNQRKELMIHRFEDKNMDENIKVPNNEQKIDLSKL